MSPLDWFGVILIVGVLLGGTSALLYIMLSPLEGLMVSRGKPRRGRITYEALPSKRERHREAQLEWERAFEDAMPPIDLSTPEGLAEARRLERIEKTRAIGARARGEKI